MRPSIKNSVNSVFFSDPIRALFASLFGQLKMPQYSLLEFFSKRHFVVFQSLLQVKKLLNFEPGAPSKPFKAIGISFTALMYFKSFPLLHYIGPILTAKKKTVLIAQKVSKRPIVFYLPIFTWVIFLSPSARKYSVSRKGDWVI